MKLFKLSILLVSIILAISSEELKSQNVSWPIRDKVLKEFAIRETAPLVIQFDKNKSARGKQGESVYAIPGIDWYSRIKQNASSAISVVLEMEGVEKICDFIAVDLECDKITENASKVITGLDLPLTFQGIIRGEEQKNHVVMTIFSKELSITVYTPAKTFSVYPVSENSREKFAVTYEIRNQKDWFKDEGIDLCGTENRELKSTSPQEIPYSRTSDEYCIYVFVECFDSLFAWRDSSFSLTIDYVFELFNHVRAAFTNEQLNVKISTINVWTTADPYNTPNRTQALADLSAYYQDNYWGNICVGLDYSVNGPGRSGLAGDIGRVKGAFPNVCPMYTVDEHTFCYNDLDYNVTVQDFPAGPVSTQPQVYLVTHEIGHLVGSNHTQWCGWNLGNNTFGALDNCAPVEPTGGCSPGPDPPPGGGTIMSYCVNGGESTSFNNGFGPMPGNAIRSFVDGNPCLSLCPSCPVTPEIDFTEISIPGVVYNFESSGFITATGVLTSSEIAVLDAEDQVKLTPGFHAEAGAIFKAFIDGCGGIR